MSKIRSILLLILTLSKPALCDTVFGFVRDQTDNENLSYVNVFIPDTEYGTVTNDDGYYVISGIQLDTLTIKASIIGYVPVTQQIDFTSDTKVRLDFSMTPQVLELPEIIVTTERQRFENDIGLSTVHLGNSQIQDAPSFVEADVFRTLQLLPGVQGLSDFSSALYVRGGTPDQNLILLDGVTIYNPFHLGGVFSTFNTDAIKEAELSAGGFSSKYGGRMGSILEITNKDGNAKSFSGKVNISLISSKILLEGPLLRIGSMHGSYMVSGRRTYFDTIVNGVLFLSGKLHDPGIIGFPYYFYDYQAKLNLDVNPVNRITLTTYDGKDVLYYDDSYSSSGHDSVEENPFNYRVTSRNTFDWGWNNKAIGINWRWIVSPKSILRTHLTRSSFNYLIGSYDYDSEEYVYGNGLIDNYVSEKNFEIIDRVEDTSIRSEITLIADQGNTILAGLEKKDLRFNLGWVRWGSIADEDTSVAYRDTSLWIEHRPSEYALFVEHKSKIISRTLLRIGLRMSYYSLHDNVNLEPRFGLKYLWTSNLALTFGWGQYYQYLTTANPNDENLRLINLWLPVPPDRPAPRAEHTIGGIEYIYNNINIRLEIYRKTLLNLLYMKDAYLFLKGKSAGDSPVEVLSEFYPSQAKVSGLEFLISKPSGRVSGWLGYTYSHTLWHTDDIGWYSPNYDRTHTINLVAGLQLNEKWHVGTAYSYATGNPYTPVVARYSPYQHTWYTEDELPNYSELSEEFIVGEKNSIRYPSYHRWDVSFIRRTPWREQGTKEIYISIMNIFNRANVLGYVYSRKTDNNTGDDLGIERWVIPMLPILPTIGVRYEF